MQPQAEVNLFAVNLNPRVSAPYELLLTKYSFTNKFLEITGASFRKIYNVLNFLIRFVWFKQTSSERLSGESQFETLNRLVQFVHPLSEYI